MEVVAVGEDVVGDVEVAVGVNVVDVEEEEMVVEVVGVGRMCWGRSGGGFRANQWLQFHFAVMSTCGIMICI